MKVVGQSDYAPPRSDFSRRRGGLLVRVERNASDKGHVKSATHARAGQHLFPRLHMHSNRVERSLMRCLAGAGALAGTRRSQYKPP
jgi:hypothetical protein